jgi:hypothetical protein
MGEGRKGSGEEGRTEAEEVEPRKLSLRTQGRMGVCGQCEDATYPPAGRRSDVRPPAHQTPHGKITKQHAAEPQNALHHHRWRHEAPSQAPRQDAVLSLCSREKGARTSTSGAGLFPAST